MYKRFASILALLAYCALLIKVMVFKDLPTIRVGQLMLNFGGTDSGHAPNFIPFATIWPYLLGYKGIIIAGINLVGNIALLVPLGFLLPFVFSNLNWKKSLALAVASGLSIECLQVILHVGIFDIDDVLLNALGFMIGYGACVLLITWVHAKAYYKISIAVLVCVIAGAAFYGTVVYPISHQPLTQNGNAGMGQNQETAASQTGDLCGGTGGIGEIVSIGTNTFTITQKDGNNLVVLLAKNAAINTPDGSGTLSDLNIGERVTLVGGPNSDGSFTADAVFVCS